MKPTPERPAQCDRDGDRFLPNLFARPRGAPAALWSRRTHRPTSRACSTRGRRSAGPDFCRLRADPTVDPAAAKGRLR